MQISRRGSAFGAVAAKPTLRLLNAGSAAMTDAQAWLGDRRPWLNRGDLGLGHEAIMAWHEAARRSAPLWRVPNPTVLGTNPRSGLCVIPSGLQLVDEGLVQFACAG